MSVIVERPVYVDAGSEHLFGIHSVSTDRAGPPTLVTLAGGSYLTSTNRNRLSVHLCRRAAASGLPSFRFDYHGVGESTGILDEYRLDKPFTKDLSACLEWLRGLGSERFVLFGTCFGARTALVTAASRGDVEALVLAFPPLRDFGKGERTVAKRAASTSTPQMMKKALSMRVIGRLADADHRRRYRSMVSSRARLLAGRKRGPDLWVSDDVLDPLSRLAARRVPVLLIYGTADEDYADLLEARDGRLGKILDHPDSRIEIRTPLERVQGMSTLETQHRIVDETLQWVAGNIPGREQTQERT